MSNVLEMFKHKGLSIRIENDEFGEDPTTASDLQWKPYSFNTNHTNFKEPSELGLENGKITNPGLRQKLKVGLAFFLSYYEHGLSMWMISAGQIPAGVEFKWDGTAFAGLLVWEHKPDEIGGKTYKDRMKDAEGFIESYTSWCNGSMYAYVVKKPCGSCGQDNEVLDSCGGYYDIEDAKKEAIAVAESHVKAKPVGEPT